MRTKLVMLCYIMLLACSDKNETPEDIIPEEKMIPLIIDIYVAESKVSSLGISRDSSLAIFEVYEDTLFEKHSVDEKAYRKSVSWYYDHPEKMETIYESILDSLNLREQQLKEIKTEKENGDKTKGGKDDNKEEGKK